MQIRLVVFPLALIFLFAACTPAAEVPSLTSTSDLPTWTSTPGAPPQTPRPTITPRPTFTSTVLPEITSSPTPATVFLLCSPLAEQTLAELSEIITDPYNPPRPGKEERHHGTDFAYYRRKGRTTIEGEVVQSILPAKVILVSYDQLPYGNMVILETAYADLPEELALTLGIQPEESLYHLYAHFRTPPRVETGQEVACGQALGEVGTTGYNIVNPHLHLETRIGLAAAAFTGGMRYYDTRATASEQANYEFWRTSGAYRHFDPMDLFNWYLQQQTGD